MCSKENTKEGGEKLVLTWEFLRSAKFTTDLIFKMNTWSNSRTGGLEHEAGAFLHAHSWPFTSSTTQHTSGDVPLSVFKGVLELVLGDVMN